MHVKNLKITDNNMKNIRALLLCSLLLASANAQTADTNKMYTLDELMNMEITIATGTPVAQKLAPAVTSIITSDEIRKSGARTLHEALESVPGLHVYPAKGFAMKQNISIRGIQTVINPQVLILIDGIPLRTTYYGSPAMMFTMTTSVIHRIEVIRGSGSALYGADAFSGVVNVITKKWANISDEAGLRYGSFDTYEAWVNKRAEVGEVTIGLALSLTNSDGDDGRIIQKDAFSASPASLAPGALDSRYDTMYLHADAAYKDFELNILGDISDDIGNGPGASQTLDHTGHVERYSLIADLKHTNKTLFDDTTITSGFSYSTYEVKPQYNVFPAGAVLPFGTFPDGAQINPTLKENNYLAYVNAIYTGIDKHTINSGIGYTYGKAFTKHETNFGAGVAVPGTLTDVTDTPFVFMNDKSRDSYYVFIQDEYTINDRFGLTSGIRYDNYSDFGGTVNPRIALVWQANDDVTVKTMYSKAFRAPAFNELYLQNNPLTLGNENLQPEEIDTYEIALDYRAPIHTKLNIFYYKAKDLIDYANDALPATTRSARNSKDQNGYGLELELEYNINKDFVLRGNYSYQHSEDADTKDRVADAPVHQAFAQVQYHPSQEWNVNAQYHYIGKRYRVISDTREAMSGDSLVNLTIERKKILKNVDMLVSARNLFDADYREPSNGQIAEDYPMQGRYVYAELRYTF